MATPAERIYEVAAGVLGAQQEAVGRITATVAPVGAAAAAAALLIKPALVNVDQAGLLQVAGLVVGGVGMLLVLSSALAILGGVEMQSVDSAGLLEATRNDPSVLRDGERFHLELAETIGDTRQRNDEALGQLQADFVLMTAGLLMEIAGLALAAAVHF